MPGESSFVGMLTSEKGEGVFGMVRVKERKYVPAWRCDCVTTPVEQDGEKYPYILERVEYEEDGKTLIGIRERWLSKSKQAISAEFEKRKAELSQLPSQGQKINFVPSFKYLEKYRSTLSAREQDLFDAQRKVLSEQYPDTFAAIAADSPVAADSCANKAEKIWQAFVIDSVRLHKGGSAFTSKLLSELLQSVGKNAEAGAAMLEVCKRIAKAEKSKSPFDNVDHELAANWDAAGYSRMKPPEYTAAINAKLGTNISVSAMKARAITKLRLVSRNNEGRPERGS